MEAYLPHVGKKGENAKSQTNGRNEVGADLLYDHTSLQEIFLNSVLYSGTPLSPFQQC